MKLYTMTQAQLSVIQHILSVIVAGEQASLGYDDWVKLGTFGELEIIAPAPGVNRS